MCFCVLLYFTACMLYYCNMVGWAWWDWGLIWWLTILLQCFDTVGWVIWPVKISSPNDLYCVEWDVKPYSTQCRCCSVYTIPHIYVVQSYEYAAEWLFCFLLCTNLLLAQSADKGGWAAMQNLLFVYVNTVRKLVCCVINHFIKCLCLTYGTMQTCQHFRF